MPGIQVHAVSKQFRRYALDRPTTLQGAFLHGFSNFRAGKAFWALQDVSLDVGPGEMVGVIGRNGAGKSTLLRLVGGVGAPTSGRIVVDGRLGALIDLGAGFHPDLTGRENVYLNGVISGFTRRQVAGILDDIVDFAELGAFIDNSMHSYSSGMQLRLAFAVAVHVQPEVLLVDEVLAVGDLGFQRKCLDRIDRLRATGASILFVTHDLELAQRRCSRILWLEHGRVAGEGPAGETVERYRQALQPRSDRDLLPKADARAHTTPRQRSADRPGTHAVELVNVRLADRAGAPLELLLPDHPLVVQMHWRAAQPVPGFIVNVGLYGGDDRLLCELNQPVGTLPAAEGQLNLCFERLDLAAGAYDVDVSVSSTDWATTYDHHFRAYRLVVGGHGEGKGPLRPPVRWESV